MSDDLKNILKKVCDGEDLIEEDALRIFQIMLNGGMTPAQIGSILTGFHIKGETIVEIVALAKVLKSKCIPFVAPEGAIDNCGTGGDVSGSYNISTASAFVIAAAGIPVAKHGNRAISSLSGSADVLQHLGVNVEADQEIMKKAIKDTNLCFLKAPKFHKSMLYVSPIRKELGIRTIFNIVGPLVNPANIDFQLLGVFTKDLLVPAAEVLKKLGIKRAWIVHGSDGMDEITITGKTYVAELKDNKINCFEINPTTYGIDLVPETALQGQNPSFNAQALRDVLNNKGSKAYTDIVLLNSAAAIVISGKANDLNKGLEMAKEAIKNGRAMLVLENLIELTNGKSELS